MNHEDRKTTKEERRVGTLDPRVEAMAATIVDAAIFELKAVDELTQVHYAQLLTYLKLSGHRLGFLINFNAVPLKNGIRRLVH